jgi:DNA-3-methyladenine glycosylase II
VHVTLPGAIDLAASLRPLGRWGDDGLDRWDGQTLVRTIQFDDGVVVPYSAHPEGAVERPALVVAVPEVFADRAADVTSAIRATFVTVPSAVAALAAADKTVGHLVSLYPGIVPVLVPDPFAALIRSISAQQVNLRWASTIRRRLAERYGERHEVDSEYVYSLLPGPLADATVEELRALQLTTAKSRSVIACARAAVAGELRRADLAAMADEALIAHLTRIKGIGTWSAEWFLARTLGRARVVAGDLGVRKAVGRMYGHTVLPSEAQVRDLTANWGESATVVQALALHDLAVASGNA